jgi:hypothetical protein
MWIARSHHVPTSLAREAPQSFVAKNVSLDPKQPDLSTADLSKSFMLCGEIQGPLKQLYGVSEATSSKPRVMSEEFVCSGYELCLGGAIVNNRTYKVFGFLPFSRAKEELSH